MASAYSSPGSYKTGVWLVSLNGKGAIVDRAHLPKQGTGYEYYWLGSTPGEAQGRLYDALSKLQIVSDQIPTDLHQAFSKGVQNLNFDTLQPFTGSHNPNTGYNKATTSAGQAARQATVTAAQTIGSAVSVGALFTSGSLWAGIGMTLLGAFLVLFGIIKLSGADPGTVAKRVMPG